MSELAVKGCSFKASSDAGMFAGNAKIDPSSQASNNVLVDNKGVYFTSIDTLVSGTLTPSTVPAGTTGVGTITDGKVTINGTASNVLEDGNASAIALQKGDKGTATLTFTFKSTSTPPSDVPLPFPVTVEITDAGQTYSVAS